MRKIGRKSALQSAIDAGFGISLTNGFRCLPGCPWKPRLTPIYNSPPPSAKPSGNWWRDCQAEPPLARLSIIISFAPPREGIFRRHLTIYSAAVDQLMRDYCYELEMFLLFIGIDTIFYLHITWIFTWATWTIECRKKICRNDWKSTEQLIPCELLRIGKRGVRGAMPSLKCRTTTKPIRPSPSWTIRPSREGDWWPKWPCRVPNALQRWRRRRCCFWPPRGAAITRSRLNLSLSSDERERKVFLCRNPDKTFAVRSAFR